MELDTDSLRVAFLAVALTMLTLFLCVTYRVTRAPYCLWWCWALALFVGGSAGYLLNGTEMQRWANPLGNGVVVAGTACVWAAARSLRGLPTRPARLAAGPIITLLASMLDDPATNTWAGGIVFLAAMSLFIGLASRELWRQERASWGERRPGSTYEPILRSLALVSALVSLYYMGRWVAFVSVGQDGDAFTTYFGPKPTTLIMTVLLATVSFSMSSLSSEQQNEGLRERATRDGLTGLLNRAEFLRLAHLVTSRGAERHSGDVVMLADLDHFKRINDSFGHHAGDDAIRAFADVCRQAVREDDLVGRYGGEEFILLLPETTLERAEQVTAEISSLFRTQFVRRPGYTVTASYGIAPVDLTDGLEASIAAADNALYRAKARGRDQAATSGDPEPSSGAG